MAGGVSNGRGCGGGADPAFCFSFRIMWRAGGKAEAYLYVPEGMQAPDFCTVYPDCSTTKAGLPCTSCNYKAGAWAPTPMPAAPWRLRSPSRSWLLRPPPTLMQPPPAPPIRPQACPLGAAPSRSSPASGGPST
jgi:hypothetical protein